MVYSLRSIRTEAISSKSASKRELAEKPSSRSVRSRTESKLRSAIKTKAKKQKGIKSKDTIEETTKAISREGSIVESDKEVIEEKDSSSILVPLKIPKDFQETYSLLKQQFDRHATPMNNLKESSSSLIGRESEFGCLQTFLEDPLARAIYISGVPGTGKSALVTRMVNGMSKGKGIMKVVNMNCLKKPKGVSLLEFILEELGLETKGGKPTIPQFENMIYKGKWSSLLLVLDEMDQLLSSNETDILYKLFGLAYKHQSKLKLIGIANDLNLIEKSLPRLRAKQCDPDLLVFQPYKVDQITSILTNLSIGFPNAIRSDAIELLSRKVASVSGDLRKALDFIRQAIDLAYHQFQESEQNEFVSIGLGHVKKCWDDAQQSTVLKKVNGLHIHAHLVLIALIKVYEQGKPLVVNSLLDEYVTTAQSSDFDPLSKSEFQDILNQLDSLGLIHTPASGGPKFKSKIKSKNSTSSASTIQCLVPVVELRAGLARLPLISELRF